MGSIVIGLLVLHGVCSVLAGRMRDLWATAFLFMVGCVCGWETCGIVWLCMIGGLLVLALLLVVANVLRAK